MAAGALKGIFGKGILKSLGGGLKLTTSFSRIVM
jgi:hypothetical protein